MGLVKFPNHGNPGDPAIWLGTRALLRELGVEIVYSAAWWNFDPRLASRSLKGAPVLLNGGGNFGDLYAGQQGTRETVLQTMRDVPVIQMPAPTSRSRAARKGATNDHVARRGHPDDARAQSAGIVREALASSRS